MSHTVICERTGWAGPIRTVCLAAFIAGSMAGCIPDLGADIPLSDAGSEAQDASPTPDAAPTDGGSVPRDAGPPMDAGDLLMQGDFIFHVNAGGVTGGCASCHGQEGRGDVGIGPNIRGRSRDAIVWALRNVDLMQRVHLTTQQIDAVAAYTASLVP